MRRLLLVAAALLIVGAFFVPVHAVEGGGRTLEGFAAGVLGLTLLLLAVPEPWRRAGRLASLLVVAGAAQLVLTKPTWLQYLELRPRLVFDGWKTLAAVAVASQALVVFRVTSGSRLALLRAVAGRLRGWRLPVVLVGFVACAAHFTLAFQQGAPSPVHLAFWIAQLLAIGALLVVNLVHLGLLVRAIPREESQRLLAAARGRISFPGDAGERPWDRRVAPLLALATFLIAAILNVFVLERTPHVPDGLAYVFQAKTLASGHLTVDPPPVPEGFEVYLLDVRDGRWLGTTNPGWPLALAAGVALGIPSFVNPILAALTILLVHGLVRRLTDRGYAHAVALLLAASPWALFLAASWMTHTVTLLGVVLGWWGLVRAHEGRALAFGLLGGLGMGFVFLVRPLDAVIAGGLTGLLLLVRLARRRYPAGAVLGYVVGCILTGGLYFAYNDAVAGDPFQPPINRYLDDLWYPGANRLGFGEDVGNPPTAWGPLDPLRGHGLPDVLINTNQNLYNLDFELLGWPVGSLLLLVVWLLHGDRRPLDRAAALLLLVLLAVYNLYWFSGGPDYGARYWYLMIVPAIWLTVRGAQRLGSLLAEDGGGALPRPAYLMTLAFLIFVSLTVFVPWRAVAKYREYRGFHTDFRELLDEGAFGRALVLIRTDRPVEYGCAFILNEPGLPADRPVFAWERDEEYARRLREAFADRPVIVVDGRAVTRGRVRIHRGR